MAVNARNTSRAVVYQILPDFRARSTHRNVLYQVSARLRFRSQHRNVVYQISPIRARSVVSNIVYSTDATARTVITVPQALNQVIYDTSYQFEISNNIVGGVINTATYSWVEALPISKLDVKSFTQLVVVGAEYDTTAMKFIGQNVHLINQGLPQLRPADVWSNTGVGSEVMLVCQSLDIEYVPRSGVDSPSVVSLVSYSSPVKWETRPADVGTVTHLASMPTDLFGLPDSFTSSGSVVQLSSYPSTPPARVGVENVPQIVSLASIPVGDDPTVGVEKTSHVSTQAVLSSEYVYPQSDTDVGQVLLSQVESVIDELPISPEDVSSVVSLSAIGVDSTWRWSDVYSPSVNTLAIQDSPQPPLESYFVLNAVGSATVAMLLESDFGPAHKDSYTETYSVPILTLMTAPKRFYPPLDNVVELEKGNHVTQYVTSTAVKRDDGMPISSEDVASLSIVSGIKSPMPTPEEMAKKGDFISGLAQHTMVTSSFPSTEEPQSRVETGSLAENIAVTAYYPDIRLPMTVGQTDLVAFNIANSVDYPPVKSFLMYDFTGLVTQNIACKANYLPANTLNSLSLTTQTSANVAFSARYPDKSTVYSRINSAQVSSSLAMVAEYPDKDSVLSDIKSTSVYQNVVRVDSSLYHMPHPPQRHRVRIVCKMIYGYKNR